MSNHMSGPATPLAIHLHLPGLDTNFQSHTPLTNETQQRPNSASPLKPSTAVIELFDSSDDNAQLMAFPPITQALTHLDSTMPLLNYQQYEAVLKEKGILYVNSVTTVQCTFFTEIVGMSEGAVGPFIKHAASHTHCAQKEKGKAIVSVKKEDKEN